MKVFGIAFIPALLAQSDYERGLRKCEGVSVSNTGGVQWLCGQRGPQLNPKKKCRGSSQPM